MSTSERLDQATIAIREDRLDDAVNHLTLALDTAPASQRAAITASRSTLVRKLMGC